MAASGGAAALGAGRAGTGPPGALGDTATRGHERGTEERHARAPKWEAN